jgi:hypothetical protein
MTRSFPLRARTRFRFVSAPSEAQVLVSKAVSVSFPSRFPFPALVVENGKREPERRRSAPSGKMCASSPDARSCRYGFRGYSPGMAHTIQLRLHAPGDLGKFRLPAGVQRRLNELLDRQDQGTPLTAAERGEAEGLVELAEMLSLLKLRASGGQTAAA